MQATRGSYCLLAAAEDKPHMRDHVDAILEKHVGPDICRDP